MDGAAVFDRIAFFFAVAFLTVILLGLFVALWQLALEVMYSALAYTVRWIHSANLAFRRWWRARRNR
jgi:hypothetical protein